MLQQIASMSPGRLKSSQPETDPRRSYGSRGM